MSVTINLFFIYVNIFRLVSPLVKVTYTNTLTTDTDTYRLVYTDKLLVLTNVGGFYVPTTNSVTISTADPSFSSSDYFTTAYSSHIAKLDSGSYVIAGTANNEILVFDLSTMTITALCIATHR